MHLQMIPVDEDSEIAWDTTSAFYQDLAGNAFCAACASAAILVVFCDTVCDDADGVRATHVGWGLVSI